MDKNLAKKVIKLRAIMIGKPPEAQSSYKKKLEVYKQVLAQKRNSKNKIYSLHEPEVSCIAKGKAHKPYEFGSKAAIAVTKKSGIILGVASFAENIYDGDTLDDVLSRVNSTVGILKISIYKDRLNIDSDK